MAKQKSSIPAEGVRTSPKGYVILDLPSGPIKIRLSLSEVADADEHLGKALVAALISDPMNFHHVRVAVYFGSRELNKGIRSIREAGKMLVGVDLETIVEALMTALHEGGVLKESEDAAQNDESDIGDPDMVMEAGPMVMEAGPGEV